MNVCIMVLLIMDHIVYELRHVHRIVMVMILVFQSWMGLIIVLDQILSTIINVVCFCLNDMLYDVYTVDFSKVLDMRYILKNKIVKLQKHHKIHKHTVSFTPPPLLFRCRNTLHPSNDFVKKSIVSSYCVLSVTSIVIDCNIALVSLNSGNVPIAAFATDDDVSCAVVEVSMDVVSRDCCNSDRLVVICSAVVAVVAS